MEDQNEDYLKKLYYDPESPASYSGVNKIYQTAKEDGRQISRHTIQNWLQKQKIYTENRHAITKFKRRKTIIPFQHYMLDIDSAFMTDYAKENNNNKYFVLAIDDFSKRVFTRPVKQLTGMHIKEALNDILKEAKTKPMMFRSDKGTEYVNSTVQRFLKNKKIKHVVTQNSTKAAFAERAIYTIKRRLLRAMVAKKTKHWLDLLPAITSSYNKSYHRTIGMKPIDVSKENEADIWKRVYWPKIKVLKKGKQTTREHKKDFRYKVGDTVKITTEKGKFDRGYNTRFSLENFNIADRHIRQGIEVYTLKDMDNELILGTFYPQEIQRISSDPNEEYSIEKILRTRQRNGKKQYLIRWAGYSSKWDSWIDADTVDMYKK